MSHFRSIWLLAVATSLAACSIPARPSRAEISFSYSYTFASAFSSSYFSYDSISGKTVPNASLVACELRPSESELSRFEQVVDKSRLFDQPQPPLEGCDFSVDSLSTLKIKWRGEERTLHEDQCKERTHSEVWKEAQKIAGPKFKKCEK